MKKIVSLLFLLIFGAGAACAQEMPDRFTLMKDAIKYSTRADAYNAYCSEKSSMSSDYLDSFYLEESLSIAQKDELAEVMEKEVQDFLAMLKEKEPDCSDLNFMMGRLEVMRKLKDTSYLLNGVDPATLPPDDIPELKDLMLPEKQQTP